MQIKLDGNMEITAPIASAYGFLTDTQSVSGCIPDTEGFKKIDDKNFTLKAKVGIGMVRGLFDLRGSFVKKEGSAVSYTIEGNGIGSNVKILLDIQLKEKGAGATDMVWDSTFELGGLISGVGASIIKKVSEDKINIIITAIKSHLESAAK
jgi:carbon monoxide dehydrogenase subunit G